MNNRNPFWLFCLVVLPCWATPASAVTSTTIARSLAPKPQPGALSPRLSEDQLDQLVAPIALYPDLLIAQILPAATCPLDVVEASRWLQQKHDPAEIENQPWDPSVKALAHYPQLIDMLNDRLSWTRQLGAAVVDQEEDLMRAIQRMRSKAMASGLLQSTPQQAVRRENTQVIIEPAQPEVIYIPQYEPQIIYATGFDGWGYTPIRYDLPCRVGAWLDLDCNWFDFGICYGGYGYRHGLYGADHFSRDYRYVRDNHYYGNDRFYGSGRGGIQSYYPARSDYLGRWRPDPGQLHSAH